MEERGVRLEWLEHLGKALEAFFSDIRGILPEDAYRHLSASRREFLLAVRSVVDREIHRTERESAPQPRKVEVQ